MAVLLEYLQEQAVLWNQCCKGGSRPSRKGIRHTIFCVYLFCINYLHPLLYYLFSIPIPSYTAKENERQITRTRTRIVVFYPSIFIIKFVIQMNLFLSLRRSCRKHPQINAVRIAVVVVVGDVSGISFGWGKYLGNICAALVQILLKKIECRLHAEDEVGILIHVIYVGPLYDGEQL